jgi:multisubunit Na+/H+ antiporter MnhB subunit
MFRPGHRYTNDELKARLVFTVGLGLTVSFVIALMTILYGLLFVTQPMENQAPNDAAAWELLTPMILFLTGALSGVLASNGMKGRRNGEPE